MRHGIGVILLIVAGSAQAIPVTWTITDAFMGDGSAVMGSFVYDADTGVYSNFSVSTSSGTGIGGSGIFYGTNYVKESFYDSNSLRLITKQTMDTNERWSTFLDLWFDAPFTNAGATEQVVINIDDGYEEAYVYYESVDEWYFHDIRQVVSGSIVSSPNVVPVPAAVYLFASGLGLLGWLRRRQS